MDPLSITATCVGLASTITRTSLAVIGFVKDVRAARSDLDAVSRELQSLSIVLELLADDLNGSANESIPQTLQKQISGIIANCTGVVVEIEQTLKKHEGGKGMKAMKWVASGKSDVLKLQSSLEAHRSALEIALDMVTLNLTREIKADTQELLCDTSAIKIDTTQILAEIARLQEQLPRDPNQRSAGFMLERYLDNLTSYAETVCDPFLEDLDESRGSERGSIKQQGSTPSRRSKSRDSSSESSKKSMAEIPDPPVFTGEPEDLNTPHFEHWLLGMRARVTADDWEADEDTTMTYILNGVKGLAFTHLEPRLRPGCKDPFTTGVEMLEVLAQVFTNQNCDEQAWVKENKLAPQPILPKSLELPSTGPPISMTTSSPATISQEDLDLLSKADIEGKQRSTPSPSYKPGITSTSVSPSAQWSTLDEEFATFPIQYNVSFDETGPSVRQNTTPFSRISNTNSKNSSSTTAAAAAGTRTSSTDLGNKPSSSNVIAQKPQTFTFSQELSHTHEVLSVAFSPDGRQLASGSYGNTVRIWADKQGRLEQVQGIKLSGSKVFAIAFSPDGHQLAYSYDNLILISSAKQGKFEQVQALKGHKGIIWSFAFSPDGRTLASGAEDKTILIWADRQGKFEQVQELKGHKGKVSSLAFSPDGHQLASGSGDKTIRIWAARQGRFEEVQKLKGHKVRIWSVAFSPDGHQLASGSGDRTIRIWENKEGRFEQVQELIGHQMTIWSIAYSPDGRQLASSSSDSTIRIWANEHNKFKCIQELKGREFEVWCVAFSIDGRQLASGSVDGAIRIWKVEN
ncbi:WD40 repeat-like protein [Acephala macrosclerotiorum]|nr:WD40 repeat-like protein [Acephala macrosclerotiorum]